MDLDLGLDLGSGFRCHLDEGLRLVKRCLRDSGFRLGLRRDWQRSCRLGFLTDLDLDLGFVTDLDLGFATDFHWGFRLDFPMDFPINFGWDLGSPLGWWEMAAPGRSRPWLLLLRSTDPGS